VYYTLLVLLLGITVYVGLHIHAAIHTIYDTADMWLETAVYTYCMWCFMQKWARGQW